MSVYITKCGMHIKEEIFVVGLGGDLYYGNRHYEKNYIGHMKKCKRCKDYIVKTGSLVICELTETDKPFNYENSVNKIIKEYDKQFYKERMAITGGIYCPNIKQRYGKAVKMYDLQTCISIKCDRKTCAITGEKRIKKDLQLVNIFYDTKHEHTNTKALADSHTEAGWHLQTGFLVFERRTYENKYFKTRVPRYLAEKQLEIIKRKEPEKINLRIKAKIDNSRERHKEIMRV